MPGNDGWQPSRFPKLVATQTVAVVHLASFKPRRPPPPFTRFVYERAQSGATFADLDKEERRLLREKWRLMDKSLRKAYTEAFAADFQQYQRHCDWYREKLRLIPISDQARALLTKGMAKGDVDQSGT